MMWAVALAALAPSKVTLYFAQTPLKMSLSKPKTQVVRLVYKNGSADKIQIWQAGFYPNHRWILTNQKGVPVAPTVRGRTGAMRFMSQDRDKNASVVVAPGTSFQDSTPELGLDYNLKPGKYFLAVGYCDRSFGQNLPLNTRKVELTVTK